MEFSGNLLRSFNGCAPFLRRTINVPADAHAYLMGLQHRKTGGGERYWEPEMASRIYVLATEAGARRYRVSDEMEQRLLDAFDPEGARFSGM